jgi:hypothetical protein
MKRGLPGYHVIQGKSFWKKVPQEDNKKTPQAEEQY